MAVSHHSYNTLKMPRSISIITIRADKKDTILCVEKIHLEAVVVSIDEAPTPIGKTLEGENKFKNSSKTREESGKCAAEHSTPIGDSPETSAGVGKKSKVTIPKTKQVGAREEGEEGTFTDRKSVV